MKKLILACAFGLAFALFCSCSSDGSDSNSSSIARNPQTITYQEGKKLYEVNNDVGDLTLENFPVLKLLYLIKTNPTQTVVDKADTHYIADGTNILVNEAYHSTRSAGAVEVSVDSSPMDITGSSYRECLSIKLNEQLEKEFAERSKSSSSRSILDTTSLTELPVDYRNAQIKPEVGTTEKEFYLDVKFVNNKLESYSKGTAKLQAIGKNAQGNPVCYAWVLEEVTWYDAENNPLFVEETSFTESENAPRGKVNRKMAQDYADAFVKIYDLDTTLMGNPPSKVFYNVGPAAESLVDIEYLSDTGSIVNLVFWDIGHLKENGNLCGYYWFKDLFPKKEDAEKIIGMAMPKDYETAYSNAGNYLYINAYLSNDTGNVLTTLAHEFQHMISRNMKIIENKTATKLGNGHATIFEEMMSVAAEDFVFMFFPEIHFRSETGMSYLPSYEQYYHINGLETSKDFINTAYNMNYGAGFTFAAWFMRKFGVESIYNITHNELVNLDAILAGINECSTTGETPETIESLLRQYAYALLPLNSGTTFSTARPSEKAGTKFYCEAQSYGYPLIALNLRGVNNKNSTGFPETSEEWQRKFNPPDADYRELPTNGFACFEANTVANLRPYGLMIHKVGQILDNSTPTVLQFSSDRTPSTSEKMYLVIND